jgi:hypothetical protein
VRRVLALGAGVIVLIVAPAAATAAPGGDGLARERHVAADTKLARSVLIQVSDLGEGWGSSPLRGKEKQITCGKRWVDESDLVETGEASSRVFTRSGQGFYVAVYSGTTVFRTEAMANASWTRAVRPGLARCLGVFYRQTVSQPGARATLRSAEQIGPGARIAPRTAAFRLVYTVQIQGRLVPAYVDIVLLQRGRVQTSLLTIGFGAPLNGQDRGTLATALAGRLAQAPLRPDVA